MIRDQASAFSTAEYLPNTRKFGPDGFTFIEMMIVIALISFSAAVAAPFWLRARKTAQTNTCIKNQREISFAIGQWALENRKSQNAAVTYEDIEPYLKGKAFCPSGGTTFADSYSISTVAENPSCKINPSVHTSSSGDSGAGLIYNGSR